MSKAVLMSIRPEWVEKILNGEKTIEIRKTMPKCELPCKVYIYCTKNRHLACVVDKNGAELFYTCNNETAFIAGGYLGNGQVIGEFILRTVTKFDYLGVFYDYKKEELLKKSCLTDKQLAAYVNPVGYAWHIDDLKIYDRPKELSEFNKFVYAEDYPCNKGKGCKYEYYDYGENCSACRIDFDGEHCVYKKLTKAPQSWCYVEEL